MLRSIRWTMQLWHAGILMFALASFGTALYLTELHSTFSEVDHELIAAARVFAEPTVSPQPVGPSQNPGDIQLAMAEAQVAAPFSGAIATDAAQSDLSVPASLAESASKTRAIKLWLKGVPRDCLRHNGWDERDQPYFTIWGADGSVVLKSTGCPAVAEPAISNVVALASGRAPATPEFRTREAVREVIVKGPVGSTILIGQSIQRQEESLQTLRMSLLGTGGAVLVVGLMGGFLFSGRAIRPIRSISETAKSISGTDLSQRIDVHGTQSELGSLAETLNETFDRLESEFIRQRQFTADASHELRTPLSVIHAQCELALSKNRTAEEYRSAIESSLRASTRMKSLVESLLVLARADSGRLELNMQRFDLLEAAEECVAMLLSIAKQNNVRLTCRGKRVMIEGDRARILQVITNLASNAIRYNTPEGYVGVSVFEEERDGIVEVKDNGIGISQADQSRVFQRFFRADNARSRESGGSGLGLAICHSIVRSHQGDLSFSSAPQFGTKFTARLPILSPIPMQRICDT